MLNKGGAIQQLAQRLLDIGVDRHRSLIAGWTASPPIILFCACGSVGS